ncbi:MAG: FMN-binding protein [Chloroflexota bacterium]|nr:FMN-binding protein [Chloroflexota bacterium]
MTQHLEKRVSTPPPVPRSAPASPPAPAAKTKSGGKNKKIANSLVALSSAAILSVYGLGYLRTDAAQALSPIAAPTIAIATTVPTATNAPAASVAAYQSPLFPPSATAPSASDGSAHGVTASAVASSTATTVATSAPTTTATAPATATTVPSVTKAPATATTALYKDGTYTGTGTSRHGNIAASVVVSGGKIVSAAITQCGTRYPCSDIAALPGEVVTRQSATIDLVSGATDSSQAYRGAIQNALAKAKGAA